MPADFSALRFQNFSPCEIFGYITMTLQAIALRRVVDSRLRRRLKRC